MLGNAAEQRPLILGDDVLNNMLDASAAAENAPAAPAAAPAITPAVIEPVSEPVPVVANSKRPGLPSEAARQMNVQKKFKELNKSYLAEMAEAYDLNKDDVKDFIDLVPETKQLPAIEKKLDELKATYDRRAAELGEEEARTSVVGLMAQLFLGMYGVANGVDTSGIKFDKLSWDNQWKRLKQKYDMDTELELQKHNNLKEVISNKFRTIGEKKEEMGAELREFEKVEDAKFRDAMRAWQEADDEDKAGRGGKKMTPAMYAAQAQYNSELDAYKKKSKQAYMDRKIAQALQGAAQEKASKRKDVIFTQLGQAEGQKLIDKMSEGWFNSPKERLLAEAQNLLDSSSKLDESLKPLKNQLNIKQQFVKSGITSGDLNTDFKEYVTSYKARKEKEKDLSPHVHLKTFIESKMTK
jgi:hypothetical protein